MIFQPEDLRARYMGHSKNRGPVAYIRSIINLPPPFYSLPTGVHSLLGGLSIGLFMGSAPSECSQSYDNPMRDEATYNYL